MAAPEKKDSGAKGGGAAAGDCLCWGCKSGPKRFGFCEEHYEHFKFGLIKKSGEPVSDYDKKFDHYRAYVARKQSHKVA